MESALGILLTAALAAALQAGSASGEEPIRLDPRIKAPRLAKSSSPQYPAEALRSGLHGVVILECTVGADGRVTNASVIRGDSPLSDAAASAVKKWRYEPLLFEGKPKDFVLTVTVDFKPVGSVTVDGLCESLRSKHDAVREAAATQLGYVRAGQGIGAQDVAQAWRELKALLEREQSTRVRAAAEAALARLEAQ